jgi:hypothetical protein
LIPPANAVDLLLLLLLQVLPIVHQLMPLVAATQPLNALAFVLDGVLYGVGGFKYASAVMAVCAAPALAVMLVGLGLHKPHIPTAYHPNPTPGVLRGVVTNGGLGVGLGLTEGMMWQVPGGEGLSPGLGFNRSVGSGFQSGFSSNLEGGLAGDSALWGVLGSWVTAYGPKGGWFEGEDQTQGLLSSAHPVLNSAQLGSLQLGAVSESGPRAAAAAPARGGGGGAGAFALAKAAGAGIEDGGEGLDNSGSLDLLWWTWSGLIMLMAMRALTIYIPYRLR